MHNFIHLENENLHLNVFVTLLSNYWLLDCKSTCRNMIHASFINYSKWQKEWFNWQAINISNLF